MRTELELWKLIDEYFDIFFNNETDMVNCICDCILTMGFPQYQIITHQERDFMLEKMRQIGVNEFGLPYSTMTPFWRFGEREPRKLFIKEQIKRLQNEQI